MFFCSSFLLWDSMPLGRASFFIKKNFKISNSKITIAANALIAENLWYSHLDQPFLLVLLHFQVLVWRVPNTHKNQTWDPNRTIQYRKHCNGRLMFLLMRSVQQKYVYRLGVKGWRAFFAQFPSLTSSKHSSKMWKSAISKRDPSTALETKKKLQKVKATSWVTTAFSLLFFV